MIRRERETINMIYQGRFPFGERHLIALKIGLYHCSLQTKRAEVFCLCLCVC